MSILNNKDEYRRWRDEKLSNTKHSIGECLIDIIDPFSLSNSEKEHILGVCSSNNFALFQLKQQQNIVEAIISVNQQLGLNNYDQHLYSYSNGIAHITKSENNNQAKYIPYTNKAIGWHTDGYYNEDAKRIRAFTLFCINKALSGGTSEWMDHCMAYILLREDNPDIVQALTHPQAMSIPQHEVGGNVRRPKSTGPIFFIDDNTSKLSMRYTQRKKNINFLDSNEVLEAVESLDELLRSNTDYHFKLLLEPNQGIICNNVIHKRNKFIDDAKNPRLLLRGRYYDHI